MDAFTWFKGLIAAIIGGAATAICSVGGATVFGSPLDWKQISAVALSAAVFSGAAYLKQSPIPDENSVTVKSISISPSTTTATTTTIKTTPDPTK